jgi:hypothetical protein
VNTESSVSGNHPFLGPLNLFYDASHLLFAALCFCHSRILLSSAPKIAVALWLNQVLMSGSEGFQ